MKGRTRRPTVSSASTWSSFPVHRDSADEPASALCCIVSAAIHLRTVVPDEQVALRVINRLDERISFDDFSEKTVRALASAAGLQVYRPNRRTSGLEDLAWRDERPGEETLWMVLVEMQFDDPKRVRPSVTAKHFVLVLDVTKHGVAIADPHPWHAPVYTMPEADFLAAWQAGRPASRKAWAGCLARATR